jgi:thiol-disulfide isomerase/thioredoxin
MKLRFALFTLLVSASVTSAQSVRQTVTLRKMSLPDTARPAGMSNLFFAKVENKQVHYPPEWKQVEISPLLENRELTKVFVIRFQEGDGLTYVVDRNGDLDFRDEPKLQFRQVEGLKFGDVEVTVRSAVANQTEPRKVSYQIVTSSDGYVYGRISEYRQGQIRIAGKTYSVNLNARGRNYPSFDLSGNPVCLIDLNQDGDFSPRWRFSQTGDVLPREEVELSSPFILGGEKVRIVDLDPAGTMLSIQPSSEAVSIAVGFKAPAFSLKGLDNNLYTLEKLKGKIVLLEFWSVSCPFCKSILPEFNALVKKLADKDFIVLDVAREASAGEINSNLRESPREATVTLNDQSAWQTFDRQTTTPAYYLIDTRGVIRFSGYGGSSEQLKVIERLVEQIRKGDAVARASRP